MSRSPHFYDEQPATSCVGLSENCRIRCICHTADNGPSVVAVIVTVDSRVATLMMLVPLDGEGGVVRRHDMQQRLLELRAEHAAGLPYLLVESTTTAVAVLGEAVLLPWIDAGRLIDIQLLGTLTLLALDGDAPDRPTLKELARYLQRHLRHVLSPDQLDVRVPAFDAGRDIVVRNLYDRAHRLLQVGVPYLYYGLRHGDHLWSLGVQVKARIALDAMEVRGVRIDQRRLGASLASLRNAQAGLLDRLRDATGTVISTPPTASQLWSLVRVASKRAGRQFDVADIRTPPSINFLRDLEDVPAIATLIDYLETNQRLADFQRLNQAGSDIVHATFTTLGRTGRISCRNPNIQALPQDGGIREIIVPRAGYLFLVLDFRCIELFALAAHLQASEPNGYEMLTWALENGHDLHRWTASAIYGKSPETVSGSERQLGKILNFAIPANAGVKRLQVEISGALGMAVTEDDVARLKALWLDTFPAVRRFHRQSLAVPTAAMALASAYASQHGVSVRNVIENSVRQAGGANADRDGHLFGPQLRLLLWDVTRLLVPAHRPEFLEQVDDRQPSADLQRAVDHGYIVDLPSGRRRSHCRYTAALNTVFQGRVADGVKLALWALHRGGHRVVNVIHDEFLIEVPVDADHLTLAMDIRTLVLGAMWQAVPLNGLDVNFALMSRWSADATAVYDDPTNPTQLLVFE